MRKLAHAFRYGDYMPVSASLLLDDPAHLNTKYSPLILN